VPEFNGGNQKRIHAFNVSEAYLFKYYFEETPIYNTLEPYYNEPRYRFEVPEKKFEEIQNFLAEYDYALIEIDDPSEFVVVVEKYSDHPEDIFKDSVLQQSDAEYNFFLRKDLAAVEQATHEGATRLTDTDLVVPF
jgi:hypothetical protein